MKTQSRLWICASLLAAGFGAAMHGALAFEPTGPVEIVAHAGPGSGVDLFGRSIGAISDKEKLQKSPFRLVPKTGGNGAIAMSYLAEKAGSPTTLGVFTTVWIATPLTSIEAKISLKELSPIAILVTDPAVAVVKANSPYRSMSEFIEAAKKTPGQLKQAGGSFTSVDNLARMLIQKHTGASWALISFPSGGERMTNLLGEHMQVAFMQPTEIVEHLRSGSVRAIAAITEKRLPAFPNVPTLAEQGINIPIPHQVRGVVAPPGLTREAREYWDDFFRRLTETASWKKYVEENQFESRYMRGAELERFLESDTNSLRSLLKEAGAKVVR